MSTKFKVPAHVKKSKFIDVVSIDDAVRYEIDFTAWQEDNSAITGAVWAVEHGSVGVTEETLSNGVASALVTFNDQGRCLISILASTATEKKKVWLEIRAKDYEFEAGDYGVCS